MGCTNGGEGAVIRIIALKPRKLDIFPEARSGALVVREGLELDDRVALKEIYVKIVEDNSVRDLSDKVLPHSKEVTVEGLD